MSLQSTAESNQADANSGQNFVRSVRDTSNPECQRDDRIDLALSSSLMATSADSNAADTMESTDCHFLDTKTFPLAQDVALTSVYKIKLKLKSESTI